MTDNSHYVRLTPEQLAELRELDASATPGPWDLFDDYGLEVVDGNGERVPNDGVTGVWNWELVVAARNALRPLLDELESLRTEVERLRRVRDAAVAVGRGLAAGEVFAEDLAAVNLQAALAATKEQP